MKAKTLLLIFCLIYSFGTSVLGQNKFLTMDDVVLSARRGLVPEKVAQLQWNGNSNEFSYIRNKEKNENLIIEVPPGKSGSTSFSLVKFNAAVKTAGFDTLTSFPTLTWKNKNEFYFNHSDKILRFSMMDNKVVTVLNSPPKGTDNHQMNSDFTGILFNEGNNLWLMKQDGAIQITFDTDQNVVNGQIVHREEFGIHQGSFWSPKNNLFAFYRMDQTMVTDYPIIELENQPAKTKQIKYPMAGGVSHQVTIGVYNILTGKTIFLNTGTPADQYLTNICWSPDEKKIYVGVLNREQDHLRMNRYDALSGNFETTLFEENEEKYVHSLNPVVFNKNGTHFIWQSRRDGYNHLYLYDVSGKLVRQLTKGNWEVIDFYGFDQNGKFIFYSSNQQSPINRDIYKCDISNGKITRISSGDGINKATFSATGEYYLQEFTGPGIPGKQSLVSASGKVLNIILESRDPLMEFLPVIREVFTIKSEGGDDLYCRMVKPNPFDSTKSYPVVVYVYGGPGLQLITNTWTYGADLWSHYMAQRGYIVFTLDNRGTPNRGKSFEQSVFRNLGELELQDQISGVKFLMNLPYIDQNRMGVYGWSYGGFMSVSLMTRHPGIFRAAVAGGPVIDWSYYEIMYTERYMDTPAANPQGYSNSNLLKYVENLKGKMLLIHGTSDDVVVWQHSLMYLKKAVQKNVYPDYFVYPGHEHNVRGRDRIHLLTRVSNYFFENLK